LSEDNVLLSKHGKVDVCIPSKKALENEGIVKALANFHGVITLALGPNLQLPALTQKLMTSAIPRSQPQCYRLGISKKGLDLSINSSALGCFQTLLKPDLARPESGVSPYMGTGFLEVLFHEVSPLWLDIRGGKIARSEAECLAKILPRVERLRFSWTALMPDGFKTLVDALPGTQIRHLQLRFDRHLGDIQGLASVLAKTRVQVLNLDYSKIGDSGVEALAQVLPDSRIRSLYLRNVDMGTRGAEALTRALAHCSLDELKVSGNTKVTAAAQAALTSAFMATKSRVFVLQMGAKPGKDLTELTFRTMGGTEAVGFQWNLRKRAPDLIEEIHDRVSVPGTLKIVMPNGELLSTRELRHLKRSLEPSEEPTSKKSRTDDGN
jgi:hypothetical protein